MDRSIRKTVEIDGSSYIIVKLTAIASLQLGRLLIAKAAPFVTLLSKMDDGDTDDGILFQALFDVVGNLNDQDVNDLVTKCLRACKLDLDAGEHPVLDERGNYGNPDIEYDLILTVKLCVEMIKFNFADFFNGGGLDLKSLQIRVLQ